MIYHSISKSQCWEIVTSPVKFRDPIICLLFCEDNNLSNTSMKDAGGACFIYIYTCLSWSLDGCVSIFEKSSEWILIVHMNNFTIRALTDAACE